MIIWKRRSLKTKSPSEKKHFSRCYQIRKVEFFEEIYNALLKKYSYVLSDSRVGDALVRKIKFYDRENIRAYEFISNLFDVRAETIAALYKIHWQTELLFKQIKQNFPLKYFSGDNENAIKIQIYCVLIVNILTGVI